LVGPSTSQRGHASAHSLGASRRTHGWIRGPWRSARCSPRTMARPTRPQRHRLRPPTPTRHVGSIRIGHLAALNSVKPLGRGPSWPARWIGTLRLCRHVVPPKSLCERTMSRPAGGGRLHSWHAYDLLAGSGTPSRPSGSPSSRLSEIRQDLGRSP